MAACEQFRRGFAGAYGPGMTRSDRNFLGVSRVLRIPGEKEKKCDLPEHQGG